MFDFVFFYKITDLVFTFISLITLGIMLFGIYPNVSGHPLSLVANILYQATSKIIWAVALSYIIISCLKNGGNLKKFNFIEIFYIF